MKLLFDENLAPSLATVLADVFPDSAHVRDFRLESSRDQEVWEFAARSGFAIISKDADFRQRSFNFGHPPKVIWIRLGNCSTQRIEKTIRRHFPQIARFLIADEESFLILS